MALLASAKGFLRRLILKVITESPKGSYAQAGEDAIIKFLFDCRGMAKPTYLELGTNKPDQYNNTYLFYRYGSRGVCVEADQSLIPAIKKVRPGDIVLNKGVSANGATDARFYILNDPGLNTFDETEAKHRESFGNVSIVKVVNVQLQSINQIIEENFLKRPDILSIDIEGMDLAVLQTLDFNRFPIPVICAETCTYSENHIKPKNEEIIRFMQSNGYFIYADTYINTIFVNETWFYN